MRNVNVIMHELHLLVLQRVDDMPRLLCAKPSWRSYATHLDGGQEAGDVLKSHSCVLEALEQPAAPNTAALPLGDTPQKTNVDIRIYM